MQLYQQKRKKRSKAEVKPRGELLQALPPLPRPARRPARGSPGAPRRRLGRSLSGVLRGNHRERKVRWITISHIPDHTII